MDKERSGSQFVRPWEVILGVGHYDRRIDLYGLREAISQEVLVLKARGLDLEGIEVIPYDWQLDENFGSILMRGQTADGPVGFVYSTKLVMQPDGTHKLIKLEELDEEKIKFEV